MTWRENLRKVTLNDGRQLVGASFRGEPFFVESVERSGGRRAVVHEFPLRDDPFVEDLGRKARGYRVEGYVLGDDYLADRDNLLAALEREGVGQLQLPYYDLKRAICTSVTVRETKTEGGMAVFSLEFAEAPNQKPVPAAAFDAPAQVAAAADTAIAAAKAELGTKLSAAGLPAYALESTATALLKATDALEEKLAPVISVTQDLAQFTGQIQLITARASTLVRTPDDVFDAFRAAITVLADTAEAAPDAVMDALFGAYPFLLGGEVLPTTAIRTRELANQAAIAAALRRIIAIEAARLVPLVSYVSIEEATAARDQAASMLEEQAGSASDSAYPALVDLRSQVLRAVPGGQALASVTTIERKAPLPSILVSYQLYGSVDKADDIVARNGISHPGFCSGTLKVLSDG